MVTGRARHRVPGRAGPRMMNFGLCRAWAGPKNHVSCWTIGPRAFCTSILSSLNLHRAKAGLELESRLLVPPPLILVPHDKMVALAFINSPAASAAPPPNPKPCALTPHIAIAVLQPYTEPILVNLHFRHLTVDKEVPRSFVRMRRSRLYLPQA